MAEGVNVRLTGPLRRFIERQAGPEGTYESVSEYIRDLIRRDFEREQRRRWAWLRSELRPGIEADEEQFEDFDADDLIAQARREAQADAS